jgi:hypothetical protein
LNRPTRMSDVAKLASVGTVTVSRVLNHNVHVTEETRAREAAWLALACGGTEVPPFQSSGAIHARLGCCSFESRLSLINAGCSKFDSAS